jgi:hypothetical protein
MTLSSHRPRGKPDSAARDPKPQIRNRTDVPATPVPCQVRHFMSYLKKLTRATQFRFNLPAGSFANAAGCGAAWPADPAMVPPVLAVESTESICNIAAGMCARATPPPVEVVMLVARLKEPTR